MSARQLCGRAVGLLHGLEEIPFCLLSSAIRQLVNLVVDFEQLSRDKLKYKE